MLCLPRSFVWHKKLEKQLVEGADPRELTQKAERQRQAEREVRHTRALSRLPLTRGV